MTPKFEYPALVKQEAKNLLKHATQAERDNLDFENFKPKHSGNCIYGQMTGTCFSERAEELIKKCATQVYDANSKTAEMDNISILADILVGSPKGRERYKSNSSVMIEVETDFYSPIEVFVYEEKNQKSGANENLIKYLRGEIKTL
jgi:hypothetical protein